MGVADAVRFLGAVQTGSATAGCAVRTCSRCRAACPADGRAGEGFGIVYLEAAAYGKPVVAGNVAGALDAVADGETGLLVDPTDERAVADALTRLLLDRELAQRLGAREPSARGASRGLWWPRASKRCYVNSSLKKVL